jgi:P pilus assembly chaperone PapD
MKCIKNLFLFLFFSINIFAFKLSPDYFDKRIDGKGSSEEITFWNDSNESVRYKIYVEKVDDGSPDMSKWVEVYPKILTIKPKSTGKVRVFAKAPSTAKEPEYQFYLGARTIAIPKNEGGGTQLAMPINLKMRMYGYNGDIKPLINLKNQQFFKEGNQLKFKGTLINKTEKASSKVQVLLIGNNKRESFTSGRIKKGDFYFNISLKNFTDMKEIKEIIVIDEMTDRELQKIKIN